MTRDLRVLALLPLLVLATVGGDCNPTPTGEPTPEPEPCQRPENRTMPEVVGVQGPQEDQPAGFAVPILAQVSDPDGIAVVTLFHRITGEGTFLPVSMNMEAEQEDGSEIWSGSVPGNYVTEAGVEFYVSVRDAGPCADVTLSPEGAPDDAIYGFDTIVATSPVPLFEDFEVETCTASEDLAGGWVNIVQKFPDPSHAWGNSQSNPYSGVCAVRHTEGVPGFWECPEEGGTQDRKNWLISPALDLTTKTALSLRFQQRARVATSTPCAEVHEVWVSTGSPDPGDDPDTNGDYELVATLDLPTADWAPSPWIDLSAYAGAERAYVALVYRGGAAWAWYVDDLYVGEPLADLVLANPPTLDSSTEPGATGLTLDLEVANVGAEYDAPALSALLETGDPDITITQATASYEAIPVGESAFPDVGFSFDIDAGHADNAYLDFTLRLDDGAGHTWALPFQLLLGEESFATVAVNEGDQPVQLTLGNGPVALPNFFESISSGATGGNPWVLNVTNQAEALPPSPGPGRWFLTVDNSAGTTDATLETFEFLVGGATTGPDDLPTTVPAGESVTVRFPPRPELSVTAVTTDPEPAAPGGAVTLQSLEVTNDGASTVAAISCVLDSADPLVSGISSGVITFGTDPIGNGDVVAMEQTPSFDVDATATQNQPVSLILLCSDGFDSLPVPFEVEVPYARPVVDSVLIEDFTTACTGCSGDGDGLADPGETVAVTLVARNDGGLPLDAPLTATVAASPNSPTSFTLSNGNNITFGSALLAVGETVTADVAFELGVDPAAILGDRMTVEVTFSSGSDTWVEEYDLDVTGLPWLPCNGPGDAMGDVLPGNQVFDIASCDYRSDNATLQVRVNSWTPFDASIQSLWFLFYEAPSQYSVEFVPPAFADLEDGCLSGNSVTPLATALQVDNQLETAATLRVGLSDMSVLGRNIQVAFAAGFCGTNFCDVYPDSAAVWPQGGAPSCTQGLYIPISW